MKLPCWKVAPIFQFLLIAASCFAVASSVKAESSESLSFNRDVRPILADNCFQCHGPDAATREAGLRIDLREEALLGVEGRPAIVPGKPGESEVFRRITAPEPAERMPPREIGKVLAPEQIDLIEQWIEEGAEYEPHWAYVPPERKELPAVEDDDWGHNPIDALLLAKLEEEGISPMPEADPRTLIRRLSFDLRGLPPSTAEVDEFLGDTSPDAYERLVDRFLASPHYGERMAVYWLDLVRFADTVGYHGDQPTQVWPYRDYVIRAFNENKPFDEFTREQLAGDLLPAPTREQKVATAYNRLNMVTREGGAQPKEYVAKYASDRVRTTSSVWMGATVGCAECHDHKFDPYTAKDFYSFAAFFADIDEQGVYKSSDFDGEFEPVLRLPDDEQQEKLDEFDRQIAAVEAVAEPATVVLEQIQDEETTLAKARERIAAHRKVNAAELEAAYQQWLEEMRLIANEGEAMEIPFVRGDSGGGAAKLENWNVMSHEGRSAREQSGAAKVRHLADDFSPPETLRNNDKIYAWVYLDPENPPSAVMLEVKAEGWKHRGWWGKEEILADVPEGERERLGDIPEAGEWVRLEMSAEEMGLNRRTPIRGIAFVQHGGRAWWAEAGLLGDQRGISKTLLAALKKDANERDESEERELLAHYFDTTDLWQTSREKAAIVHHKRDFQRTLPVTVVAEAVEPRVVRILPRGDWMDESGEVVEPAVPHFLPQPDVDDERRLTRLDLADWFVSPENPLTSRTMVNRFWKLFFGEGLSRTLDDLGNRGDWPVHQDLLDWLAVEFVESGWDVKHLVKTLVTSSAYRVSSRVPDTLRERDPDNRLHARQFRPRLDAEFIRDNALKISGLLVRDVGGPSVNPYQPEGYYRELNFPKREYHADTGPDQYRRGVYTHWQRTFLHPSLMAFDAPSREECTAQRPYSNTPLQALTLLNDPTYVEAARAFAARILSETNGSDDEDRVRWAWHEALSRKPTQTESATLVSLLQSAREEYGKDRESAEELGTVGEYSWPADIDISELAAWTAVSRTILNLQETFVRY